MTQTFNCPTCGAPLEVPAGDAATLKCEHCGNTVVVPAELRAASTPAGQLDRGDLLKKAGRMGEVARLVQAGNKIEAIKLYRQLTGLGLKEAKDAVEKIAAGEVVSVSQTVTQPRTGSGSGEVSQALRGEIRRALQAGRKIEAIKLVREQTGLGLKEAKDAVEAIEAALDPADPEPAVVLHTPQDRDGMLVLAEVRNLVAAGDKLGAIKRFREHFAVGLQEAKDAVEAIEHGQAIPAWTMRPSPAASVRTPSTGYSAGARPRRRGLGCFTLVGLLAALAAVIALVGGGPLMLSGSYKQAVQIATHDPVILAALGSPVSAVLWRIPDGEINCGDTCSANYSFYVAGPRGEARVQVLSDSASGNFFDAGEWQADLRYYLPNQKTPITAGAAIAGFATATAAAPTAALTGPQRDATAGAQAKATRGAAATAAADARDATATAQADVDATATALAAATATAAAEAAQAQATAQAVTAAQAKWKTTVISETFRNNNNGWPADRIDDGSLVLDPLITKGVYRWTVQPVSGHYFNLLPGAIAPATDFVASVDVRVASGGPDGQFTFGLVFRGRTGNRNYGFFGLTNTGGARVMGVQDTAINDLYDLDLNGPAAELKPGVFNRLTVRALGADFVFQVNGQTVFTWNQPDLTGDRIGLGLDIGRDGAPFTLEFDNFEVKAP